MRILSLFDGMSCGMLALMKAGILVDRYVAYEVDKYAVQTSTHNFPTVEQRGDVFKADFREFEGFDMLIGGSPCTYWSIAQSADKRETTASGIGWELFSQYVRALHEVKPKYFVYENNKSMSNEIRLSINKAFGFEPICINSALVSAQNRQRLYWVGKRNNDGTYGKISVKQPKDRGILLENVLDDETTVSDGTCVVECVSSRGVYSDTGTRSTKTNANTEQRYEVRGGGKTNALTTVQKDNMVAFGISMQPLGRQRQEDGTFLRLPEARTDGKTTALTSVEARRLVAVQVGVLPNSNGEVKNSLGNRVYSSNAKSVTIKANGGGGGAKTGLYAVAVKDKKGYIVEDGLITVKDKKYPIKLPDGEYVIRKLTVPECKRLQTVPEWYEFPVSNTQAYKMLGNGWTIDVIAHLFQTIKEDFNNEEN